MTLNKKSVPFLMIFIFSLFIFCLPIFGGLKLVNNLFHGSLILFIGTIIIYRDSICGEIIKNKNYQSYKNGMAFIAIFLLYFSLSGMWNEEPLDISSEISHSLYIIAFIIIFKIATERLNRVKIYSILAASITILCILTLYFADKNHIFSSRLNRSFAWAPSNVIDLGGYFAIGILLIFMIIRDTGKKWLYLPALILFFGLLLTQSRNPLFSLFLASLPLLLSFKKINRHHIKTIISILVVISIVVIFMYYNSSLFIRIGQSYNSSFVRFGIWQNAFELFLQKPILGWGFGKDLDFINSLKQHITTTHSIYFAVLLKGGIVGMITFLLMIGYSLKIALSAFRKGYALECSLFIFSLLFYATQGMFVIANPDTSWMLFWLPVAILYSTINSRLN